MSVVVLIFFLVSFFLIFFVDFFLSILFFVPPPPSHFPCCCTFSCFMLCLGSCGGFNDLGAIPSLYTDRPSRKSTFFVLSLCLACCFCSFVFFTRNIYIIILVYMHTTLLYVVWAVGFFRPFFISSCIVVSGSCLNVLRMYFPFPVYADLL